MKRTWWRTRRSARTWDARIIRKAPREASRNQFVCPCHESLFAIDGKVMGGPAARPLDRYVTRVEDNKLLIGAEIRKA